ncbi:microtubule-associated Nat9 [Arctopsyche grandis]|uniref:microtubule-associated Nat9 n=1 Tax=Arctopsyche grandis TaxID=121162 RepID=UPI00406D91F9
MKINENVRLIGSKVILVPYEEHHVPKYHAWMQSEELQSLTASEPLSIEQEYEMQRSWRIDEDKCTFIILDKSIFEETHNEINSMIGDTNLFISADDPAKAEVEIMVAEPSARKKGFGREATTMMMLYGIENLRLKTFEVKISLDNTISINMFKQFDFREEAVSQVFHEVTLVKIVTDDDTMNLKKSTNIEVSRYDRSKPGLL